MFISSLANDHCVNDCLSHIGKSLLKNNIKNIHIENVAVGDINSKIKINLLGQTSNILETGVNIVERIEVNQIVLDDFFRDNNIKPDYVKIDVDGYELNVLKGMRNTIEKYLPILVVESNGNYEILDFLSHFDYDLRDLNLLKFDEIPNNIFCIKRNLLN